ncbi:MAG: D-alanyl-D-alanine carboxypeptidase/D-alanyl-D-alanine-endopeptidase [Vulcanimicrobiaceae bacterium]
MKCTTSIFGTNSSGEPHGMKKWCVPVSLAWLLALGTGAALAAPRTTLATAVNAIIKRPALSRALIGIEFYDLDKKRVIFAYNAHKVFKAASTTKLVTEGTSLRLLGPNFRFHTQVYRDGPVDAAGTLTGNLILVASGDPNLSNRPQPDGTLAFENEDHSYDGSPDTKAVPGDPLEVLREMAKQIAAKGIRRVNGSVLIDTSLFPEGDVEGGTGVSISPVVVNDNIVDVTIVPGPNRGDPTTMTVSPQTAYATFSNASKTGAAHSARDITLSPDERDPHANHHVRVSGTLPAGGPSILYAYDVPEPRRFAEVAFTQALVDAGVAIAPREKSARALTDSLSGTHDADMLLAEHLSPPLAEDMKVTLKVSDNLHASMQPYLWAALVAHAKDNYLKTGFALEHAFLEKAGLDLSGADQSDGLGDAASFAPDFMVSYLTFMSKEPHFASFERALPVLGVDGTLFNIQNGKPAAGHVHAKTGTWSQRDQLNDGTVITAKGLAGYISAADGRHLVFCAYINNLFVKAGADPAGEGHVAGQILGEIANAAYLYAP